MKGRMGAAEKLVMELSVENLSLTKTAAYFGYAFDFTQPGAEEQDEDQVAEAMRRSLQGSGRDSIRPSEVPSAQEHAQLVYRLREVSQNYFDLTVIVRLITCFRQWREEEEVLIALVPPFVHEILFCVLWANSYCSVGPASLANKSTQSESKTCSTPLRQT